MNFHIVINPPEVDVHEKLEEIFLDEKQPDWIIQALSVYEVSSSGKEHYHMFLSVEPIPGKNKTETRVRNFIGKFRTTTKGISLRKWDDCLEYFCKGEDEDNGPDVRIILNITPDEIDQAHIDYWTKKRSDFTEAGKDYDQALAKLKAEPASSWSYEEYIQHISRTLRATIQNNGNKLPPLNLWGRECLSLYMQMIPDSKNVDEALYKLLPKR